MKIVKSLLFFSSLFISSYAIAQQSDTNKPSFQLGLSADYKPTIDANNFTLATTAGMNLPMGSTNLDVGLSANRLITSPIDSSNDVEKISDYEQTKLNFSISQKITPSTYLSLYTSNPIHYNEKKFGKKQKAISFGAALSWRHEEGFGISLNAGKTNYKKPTEGYSYGDAVNGGIEFDYYITPKSKLFLGANYYKQKPILLFIDGKGYKIDKKTSGAGATIGADFFVDKQNKHNIKFSLNSGIGDVDGSISTSYTYNF